MNKLKKILMSGHTQKKEYLHRLYTDRQVCLSSVRYFQAYGDYFG